MGMDGGGRSSGGAKEIMNLRRRISLFLTRLRKLIMTREKERLAKEARERLAKEAREKARQEERLAKEEAHEKALQEEPFAELTETIRKAAASSYALWVQDAQQEDNPNATESTKELLRQIREGEMTEEIFIQRGFKDFLERKLKLVVEADFEEDDKWPPSPSKSP